MTERRLLCPMGDEVEEFGSGDRLHEGTGTKESTLCIAVVAASSTVKRDGIAMTAPVVVAV